MQAAPWKSLPVLRNHLCEHTRLRLASFHSTPISLAKWKSKWDCKGQEGAHKPSKNYERYIVRKKRAEAKKALKDYLFYGKSCPHLKDGSVGSFANSHDIPRFKTLSKRPHSSSKSQKGENSHRKCKKDRLRFHNFFHEDPFMHPDSIFGEHHGFAWSYISWEGFRFRDTSSNFRWTDESRRERTRERVWSESDGDTSETTNIGSHAHRVILGLPPCGSLSLDDVKNAFRASALRWHPDRHQGSSQAIAEEKFKLCVNAYNSLCNVLKAA